MANTSSDGNSPELASDNILILGCRFNGIGADGFFGAAKNLRMGYCTFHRMGIRTDSTYTPPPGGWQSTSDCIGAYNGGGFWWIHDNWMDHRDFDCKQAIGISGSPDTNPHKIIVERNVIFGHENANSCTPVNILADFTFRNNYVRGSRILLNVHNISNLANIQSNIFHQINGSGDISAIEVFGTGASITRNTIIGSGTSPWAIRKRTGASGFIASENVISGFLKGIYLAPDTTDHVVGFNGWYNVQSQYEAVSPISSPLSDITFIDNPFHSNSYELKSSNVMINGNSKKQMRDFFGKYPSFTHIGALTRNV